MVWAVADNVEANDCVEPRGPEEEEEEDLTQFIAANHEDTEEGNAQKELEEGDWQHCGGDSGC